MLFSLISSHLSVWASVACNFGVISKKNHCQKNVIYVEYENLVGAFPFYVLTFKSSVSFELTFVWVVQYQSPDIQFF